MVISAQTKLMSRYRAHHVFLAALLCGLSACSVDFKDGVFACKADRDCPSGLLCDAEYKRCTRYPLSAADGAGGDGVASNAVSTQRPDAGSQPTAPEDAAAAPADAGAEKSQPQPAVEPQAAADSGAPPSTGGSGGRAAPCPKDGFCYDFEAGALDPGGALWPSPSDGNGGLPRDGQLSTTHQPASSPNTMLVSRPSARDEWPKATVGFSGPRMAFAKLSVSFDYIAGAELAEPNPRVILFRFVGTPKRNANSVNVGLLDRDAMLEVQTDGADSLSAIGAAAPSGMLTHVAVTFTRDQGTCAVAVEYGSAPLQTAPFPCEVEDWQLELGLDLLETSSQEYTESYVAYFDNLRIAAEF